MLLRAQKGVQQRRGDDAIPRVPMGGSSWGFPLAEPTGPRLVETAEDSREPRRLSSMRLVRCGALPQMLEIVYVFRSPTRALVLLEVAKADDGNLHSVEHLFDAVFVGILEVHTGDCGKDFDP